jgi:hypothetical protein
MPQRADAVVTGFVRSRVLLERSLAPLRRLKRDGVISNIHYVTWDSADIDAHVAPAAAMDDVSLLRLPQPVVEGTGNQRGVVYQARNLDAVLSLVEDDDALVLKLRPDFIANEDFLREKIARFDDLCAIPDRQTALGVAMSAPVLQNKIWIPWADANQPFFFEDAAFMGRKRDLRRLVTNLSREDFATLGEIGCNAFAHVVRYARIFDGPYPMFANYLRNYPLFVNDLDYRRELVPHCLNNGFFWHLIVAHAWLLHSHFHVDAGEPGAISFYANDVNRKVDWSDPDSLRNAAPYDDVAGWRGRTRSGEIMRTVNALYSRLMDDSWQRSMFTGEVSDFPKATLVRLLENIAGCRDGRLGGIESEFYRSTAALHSRHWTARKLEKRQAS